MAEYTTTVLVAVLLTILWITYRAALPKPIPGIPHDRVSAGRILGDMPDALKYYSRTSELMSFLAQRCEELQSPVVQVFMRPFQSPWVIFSDAREAQDIMGRRHEFDRSPFMREILEVTFPHNQVHMPTNAQWRFNRRLSGDAMSPRFLNNAAAPQIYRSTLDLIESWQQKARLSKGYTIDVSEDIRMCTVDTIWAATFGEDIGSCRSEGEFLRARKTVDLPNSPDILLTLPTVLPPDAYRALKCVANSSEIPMNSPFGRNHHWFASKFYPKLRWAIACKDRLVKGNIDRRLRKFGNGQEIQPDELKSAVDLIIEREFSLARKDARKPDPYSKYIHDELAGYLNAGFDTTATTLSWGIKYLTQNQEAQQTLRSSLREAFHSSTSNRTPPSAGDITKTSLPYLDAVIEEILRCSSVIPANMRGVTMDTQILGFHVPKGTNVFIPTMGPSFRKPSIPVNEDTRSPTSRESKVGTELWETQDLADFRPERWFTRVANGEMKFDMHAAPQQMFGFGVRSCFGKRLGYLAMRIFLVLLIWDFELLPIPASLDDLKATDRITHQPQNLHVRLGPIRKF